MRVVGIPVSLNGGQTASVTFNKPGTYLYICTPHPFMIGQIVVTGPDVPAATTVVVDGSGRKDTGPMPMPGHDMH